MKCAAAAGIFVGLRKRDLICTLQVRQGQLLGTVPAPAVGSVNSQLLPACCAQFLQTLVYQLSCQMPHSS